MDRWGARSVRFPRGKGLALGQAWVARADDTLAESHPPSEPPGLRSPSCLPGPSPPSLEWKWKTGSGKTGRAPPSTAGQGRSWQVLNVPWPGPISTLLRAQKAASPEKAVSFIHSPIHSVNTGLWPPLAAAPPIPIPYICKQQVCQQAEATEHKLCLMLKGTHQDALRRAGAQ